MDHLMEEAGQSVHNLVQSFPVPINLPAVPEIPEIPKGFPQIPNLGGF